MKNRYVALGLCIILASPAFASLHKTKKEKEISIAYAPLSCVQPPETICVATVAQVIQTSKQMTEKESEEFRKDLYYKHKYATEFMNAFKDAAEKEVWGKRKQLEIVFKKRVY